MSRFNKHWQRLLILAFGHGLNDFAAGYMLGALWYHEGGQTRVLLCFLLYNLLAFGGQYFVALLLPRFRNMKLLVTLCAVANLFAVLLFPVLPLLSILLAGAASAFYHVAGGAACIQENKASSIGVFAAPGIIGLAGAGYLSYLKMDLWMTLAIIYGCFILILQIIQFRAGVRLIKQKQQSHDIIDRHDLMMILLLGIISLRSAVWNILQIVYDQNYSWLLAIALSAFLGKLTGGWISDRIGWRLYSFVSLAVAMPLVSFFKEEFYLFCIGVGLMQSAIPANTAMMIAYCGRTEKGIAFSLGAAIIVGMIISVPVQLFSANVMIFGIALVLFALSLLFFRKISFWKKMGAQ